MPPSILCTAPKQDVPEIVALLAAMQDEVQDVVVDKEISQKVVANSLDEQITWFLFKDENGETFGTCFLQSIHNYWRAEKRFLVGGFYIKPGHRKQGRFKEIFAQLKGWAKEHSGRQINAQIECNNQTSLNAFGSVGVKEFGYLLCAVNF